MAEKRKRGSEKIGVGKGDGWRAVRGVKRATKEGEVADGASEGGRIRGGDEDRGGGGSKPEFEGGISGLPDLEEVKQGESIEKCEKVVKKVEKMHKIGRDHEGAGLGTGQKATDVDVVGKDVHIRIGGNSEQRRRRAESRHRETHRAQN
jgi:hypothetical protein